MTDAEAGGLRTVAELMCVAARTAPKARGIDKLAMHLVEGEQKEALAREMRRIATEMKIDFFGRDADNVAACGLVVLVGTRTDPLNIPYCGFCGFKDCDECRELTGVCAFNSGDLGVAVGSAAAVAAAHHVDNRIMFSAGRAAMNLLLLGEGVRIAYGIPLSVSGKSPFFDRK